MRGISLVLATSLLTYAAPPTDGEPEGAPEAPQVGESDAGELPPRASLKVDATGVKETGSALGTWVEEETRKVLGEKEVQPATAADDPNITIKIVPLPGDTPGYVCEITGDKKGSRIKGAEVQITCDACTDSMLVAAITEALGQFLPKLAVEDEPPPDPDPGPDPDPDPIPEGPVPIGGLGIGGIVLAGLGVVGVGVGIGLVAIPEQPVAVPNRGQQQQRRTTVPGGLTSMIGGVALFVAGGVMWGIDKKRRREEEAKRANVSVTPTFGPGFGGATISGRF